MPIPRICSLWRYRGRFLLLLTVVALCAAGLVRAQSGPPLATVKFVNHAAQPRQEWGLATVPFARGVWTPGSTFVVDGAPSELVPFGARWPDGSVRFAQAAIRVDLAAGQERDYVVRRGTPSPVPFALSPWVQSRLSRFGCDLVVGLDGGSEQRVGLRFVELVEDTDVRKTGHFRDRIPGTDLVYDLWLTFFHDQDFARFELRVTSSNVASAQWEQPIEYLLLEPTACIPVVRGARRQGMSYGPFDVSGTNTVLLLGQTSFFDAQAHDWYGELLFHDPSVSVPDATRRVQTMQAVLLETLWGCADNWPESRAYGPFGHVPEAPPWIRDGGRQSAIDDQQRFLRFYYGQGDFWEDRPGGLYPSAGQAGGQNDFGVCKLYEIVRSGMPQGIEAARYTAGEEAYRPVHHREVDGSPLRSVNHPGWCAQGGRTHWSSTVSPDRLGKTEPQMSLSGHTHGWTGKDDEHWSSLTLSAAYMLTRSHSLRMELDNEAELYLSGHTLPSLKPGWPTNNIGSGRATGRTLLTLSWVYLLTGNQELATRLHGRVAECMFPQHLGLRTGGEVLPMRIVGPDGRTVTSGPYWSPWEESQAVMGLAACAEAVGSVAAHDLGLVVVRNLIRNGWRVDFENTRIGYAMRYRDGGEALPPNWLTNPEHVSWPLSEGFNVWALPSTRLAIHYASAYHDPVLLARAQAILAATLALRRQPGPGLPLWDEFAGWDGVP
ncbi:MAG: hypothetical protein IPM29_07765 [Planctomycetes bacterium]|nr:hypothetical protein [Planctomycetota bacterium]